MYPIRTVSRLTGVNPVTLRAWERRHALLSPTRTTKGHRLYSEDDIARIRRIIEHQGKGIPVSRIKKLFDESAIETTGLVSANEDPWSSYVRRMLSATRDFDEATLDSIYNDALSLYPIDLIANRLTTPVLRQLGEEWREQEAGIAREHFFSNFLRNKLGARFNHLNNRSSGPRLLGACPQGEFHDLGLLQFCLAAASHGYRMVVLGSDVPMAQIASASRIARCQAIVLSASANCGQSIFRDLKNLVSTTPLPIVVGGDITRKGSHRISRSGAIAAAADLQETLRALDQHTGHNSGSETS